VEKWTNDGVHSIQNKDKKGGDSAVKKEKGGGCEETLLGTVWTWGEQASVQNMVAGEKPQNFRRHTNSYSCKLQRIRGANGKRKELKANRGPLGDGQEILKRKKGGHKSTFGKREANPLWVKTLKGET